MRKIFTKATAVSAMTLGLLQGTTSQAIDLRFNAFGDISLGYDFGKFSNDEKRAEFNTNGEDNFVKNSLRGFGLAGTDFVITADVTENLIYQSEVNFQVGRGQSSEFETDVERMYLDYLISPKFNIMAGLYFTPIGYVNRNLYARAWLMRGIHVHDQFEEEYGFVPTHTTGINFHGTFDLSNTSSLMYALSIGDGRPTSPNKAIYARDPFDMKEITLLLEFKVPFGRDTRIGISGATDEINSITVPNYGAAQSGSTMQLREIVFNPYITYDGDKFGFLAEYFVDSQQDLNGNLGNQTFITHALTAEVAYKMFDRTVQPYIRYDQTILPSSGGPYYGLRNVDYKNQTADRFFIPEIKALMFGVAYDITSSNRLKVEYMRHLDGPNKEHRLAFQAAFGF